MKKIITIAAVAALTASSLASAESFQSAWEKARALQGANGTFEWNGKTFNTMTVEESLASKPANAENAQALFDAAKAKYKESQEVGFAWRDTKKYLKEAKAAIAAGEFQKAMDFAARAHYQARQGVEQAAYADKHWIDAVPPLN